MAHRRLADFFQDLVNPTKRVSLMTVGDSMTAEAGQRGNITLGILSEWQPPVPAGNVSGWIGRAAPIISSDLGTTMRPSEVAGAAGGTRTTVTPVSGLGGFTAGRSIQTYVRVAWTAAQRAASGVINGQFPRDFSADRPASSAARARVIGRPAFIKNTQQVEASILTLIESGAPASNVQLRATRRASSVAPTTEGTQVNASTPNFNTTSQTFTAVNTLSCGTGSGEPGIEVHSTGTNAGVENLSMLACKFIVRDAGTYKSAGWHSSVFAEPGLHTMDIARLLGCAEVRNGYTLTAFQNAGLADEIIKYLGGMDGTIQAPTHYVVRLGQNSVSSGFSADYYDNTIDSTPAQVGNHTNNLKLVLNRLIAISTTANGVAPKILIVSPLPNRSDTDARQAARRNAQQQAAVDLNLSFFDSYDEFVNTDRWYIATESGSDDVDGVHESEAGCRAVARCIWEDGLRALGLDPGINMTGTNTRRRLPNGRNFVTGGVTSSPASV